MINNTTNTSSKLAQTIDNIEHSSVLDELKSIARWMPYRLSSDEENTGSPKVKAISSEDGNFINPDDASLWRTFEEATEAEAKFNADGIGFVFGDRYTCITLDTTFDDGHDGIIPEIAQLERFFGSYTEWTHDRKLNVICKVEECFKNVELSCSRTNRQLRHKWGNNFAPISGFSYGTPAPIAERTGKVAYLHEILALLDKDYMNCLQLMNDDLPHFFRVAAKAFLQKCFDSSIASRLKGNKIRLEAAHDCDERVLAFLNNLLDNSRYLQSAIILEYYYNCDTLWETLSNLYSLRLPCSPRCFSGYYLRFREISALPLIFFRASTFQHHNKYWWGIIPCQYFIYERCIYGWVLIFSQAILRNLTTRSIAEADQRGQTERIKAKGLT